MKASVVVPTRNRRESLALLLESVRRADKPESGVEVIVVNDGGVAVEDLAARFGARALTQETLGVAAARNRGVGEASGEFVLFTDDDCRVDRRWILSHVQRLKREPHALVMGSVLNGLPENPWAVAQHALHEVVVEWFNAPGAGPGFFTGNNFSLRRAEWLAVGGMRDDWRVCGGEEREFVVRWAAEGGRVVVDEEPVIRHYHDLTARKFLDQQFRYGRGARFSQGVRLRRWDLYRRILVALPGLGGRARLAASQIAVGAGFAYEAVLGGKHNQNRKLSVCMMLF